jgi:hypothetical protein
MPRAAEAQSDGIDGEFLGDFIELNFRAKRGCGVPWPRFGPQAGLLQTAPPFEL